MSREAWVGNQFVVLVLHATPQTSAQRAELAARYIGMSVLYLMVIGVAVAAVARGLRMYAQLVEMGWPILIAVVAGLALIVMGYVLADVLLYWIGGGLLGAMILLSMAVAVTGTEAEPDPDSTFRTGAWTPFFLALVAGLA